MFARTRIALTQSIALVAALAALLARPERASGAARKFPHARA